VVWPKLEGSILTFLFPLHTRSEVKNRKGGEEEERKISWGREGV
jgi:hypothetical protein